MKIFKREEMSEKAIQALDKVEPAVNELQEGVDALHAQLNSIIEEMEPLKGKERAVRAKIVEANKGLSAAKVRLSAIYKAESLKDPVMRDAALDSIIKK